MLPIAAQMPVEVKVSEPRQEQRGRAEVKLAHAAAGALIHKPHKRRPGPPIRRIRPIITTCP